MSIAKRALDCRPGSQERILLENFLAGLADKSPVLPVLKPSDSPLYPSVENWNGFHCDCCICRTVDDLLQGIKDRKSG